VEESLVLKVFKFTFPSVLKNGIKLKHLKIQKIGANVQILLKNLMKPSKVLEIKNLIQTLSMQNSMKTTTTRLLYHVMDVEELSFLIVF
jgi:hypothetical protein